MKNFKKTLNESGLAVYEELAANHVDPMECYSLGWKFQSECFHNMTRDFMFKKGTVVFFLGIDLKYPMEYAILAPFYLLGPYF